MQTYEPFLLLVLLLHLLPTTSSSLSGLRRGIQAREESERERERKRDTHTQNLITIIRRTYDRRSTTLQIVLGTEPPV
uniref:Putative secreted protein n=1 Tax=Anopheles marajoara TaxID=58244 RepID=A0A2M4CC92_9DIPT